MKRRELLAWITPVLITVTIPAHAITSAIIESPLIVTSLYTESPDGNNKTLICHHPQGTEPFEIEVATPSVPAHVKNHGDTIGRCE